MRTKVGTHRNAESRKPTRTRKPTKVPKVEERVGGEWGDEVRERLRQEQQREPSTRAFAAALGLTSTSPVSRWKSKGLPSAELLHRMQLKLDVSADYLLGADVARQLSGRTVLGDLARALVQHITGAYLQRHSPEPVHAQGLAHVLSGSIVRHSTLARSDVAAIVHAFPDHPWASTRVDRRRRMELTDPYVLAVLDPQTFLNRVCNEACAEADAIQRSEDEPERHRLRVVVEEARKAITLMYEHKQLNEAQRSDYLNELLVLMQHIELPHVSPSRQEAKMRIGGFWLEFAQTALLFTEATGASNVQSETPATT